MEIPNRFATDQLQRVSGCFVALPINPSNQRSMNETGLSYSPDSPYHGTEGFLGCLSESQSSALQALQTHIISKSINLGDVAFNSLHPSLVLLRYLRANSFDVSKAADHIERNIVWRREHVVDKLCATQPHEILGCSMKDFTALFPHWHCGYDKQRRPVLYKQYGGFECTTLLEMTSVEAISQYHVWEQEACMRLCMLQSLKSGYLVETVTAVIDVAGMSLRQVDSNFMAIVKAIANIDQAQYPETLGRFFIINTPYVFPMVWKMVRTFLDPVVASKIHIIAKRSDWEPALLDFIGADNLSQTYGGTAPPLNADLHPYAEIMLSWPRDDSLTDQGWSAGKFSLASPLLPSSNNADLMNTFSPSLSSPSASTNDSNSSSGSSAYGDTVDGPDGGWDGVRAGGGAGGGVLGILKSHDGWNYELEFLKASRENKTIPREGNHRSVGFAPTVALDRHKDEGALPPRSIVPAIRKKAAPAATTSIASINSTNEDGKRVRRTNGICSIFMACLWYINDRTLGICKPNHLFASLINPLKSRSIGWLLKALKISLIMFTIVSVGSMAASAYALQILRDVASLKVEMWTGLVGMLLSAVTFLINLTGLFGYFLRNRKLLLMYCVCITAVAVAFTVIAIMCSIFLSSSPFVENYRNQALGGNAEAKLLIRRYNIIVCVGSWFVAVCAFIPMFFAVLVSHKIEAIEDRYAEGDEDDDDFFDDRPAALCRSGDPVGVKRVPSDYLEDAYNADGEVDVEDGRSVRLSHRKQENGSGEWRQWVNGRAIKRKKSISSLLVQKLKSLAKALIERRQLCVVVHVSLVVCLIFSLSMIGYGAHAIHYLLRVQFDYPMFAAYCLLYCGVTLIIIVMYGFWASIVDSTCMIWIQKSLFIPIICIAVAASATYSLGLLPGVREYVRDERDSGKLHVSEDGKLQDNVEIQLLVEGMIGFAVFFFQIVCYVSFKELCELSSRIDELSRHVHELVLVVEGDKTRRDSSSFSALPRHDDLDALPISISKVGPRRHSPWVTAEWMSGISRIAQQAPDLSAVDQQVGRHRLYDASGAIGLDRNLFATDAFGGNGTFTSMYFTPASVSSGGKLVIAMSYYRRWFFLQNVPDLSTLDKILIAWGVLVGIAFIYIKGTFVIFSSWVGGDSTPTWIIVLWKVMALTDRRYSKSDDFLVSTEGFLALVIGPMALFFAWTILARSSFRHPVGVFCSTADLYTLILATAIDIRTNFRNVSLDNITIFVLLYLLVNVIRVITSLFALVTESWLIAEKADAFSAKYRIRPRRNGMRILV